MIAEVAAAIAQCYPPAQRIGLLATKGTIATGLYDRALSRYHFQLVVPDEEVQRLVNRAIERVKQGLLDRQTAALVSPAVDRLAREGVAAIVIGCTELSLLPEWQADLPFVDAITILADAAVAIGLGQRPLPAPLSATCLAST